METNSAQHDVNDDGSVLASFGLELRGSYRQRFSSEGADLLLHTDT